MQNTKLGTSSNEDGYYQIKNIPSGTHKIVISSLGYKTKIINIDKFTKMVPKMNSGFRDPYLIAVSILMSSNDVS